MIPLIFGNKQTVEFRIHTPTYDINKIMAFIFLNAILVNYTINNQERILNNTLNIGSLENIMFSYMEQEDIEYNYIDKLIRYFKERKKTVEDFNRRSEVNFEEEKIWCNFDFNLKYSNKGLDLGSIPQYKSPFSISVDDIKKSLYQSIENSKKVKLPESVVNFNEKNIDEFDKALDKYNKALEKQMQILSKSKNTKKSDTLTSKPVGETISYYDEWATPAMPTISTLQAVEPVVNSIPENPLNEEFIADEEWHIMLEENQQILFGQIEQDPGPNTIGSPEGPSDTDSLPW
jgi:hypothetical protein